MLTYSFDNNSKEPMYQQLYKMIRDDIAEGSISAGEKLPSKRTLSEHLGISVVTAESAYRMLIEEGYIFSKERSGFFVCDMDEFVHAKPNLSSAFITDLNETTEIDIDFPSSVISKIIRQTVSNYGEKLLLKPPHNGCLVLRSAISAFLQRYRGITAPPDRIVIGSGAEYLYGMIVQLLGRDNVFGLEDPSYDKIRKVYMANGVKCEMLKMGKDGISSQCLERTAAKVIHVTPFHSFPSGITAPASKRFEYLAWAKRTSGIIIEDDFASELAVNSKPVETIFSMDKSGSVIYINTFSKSLAPSIRMGYMVLPEKLAKLYNDKLGFYSCTVPVLDQYVLAEFIGAGHFERHLNKMRRKLRNINISDND